MKIIKVAQCACIGFFKSEMPEKSLLVMKESHLSESFRLPTVARTLKRTNENKTTCGAETSAKDRTETEKTRTRRCNFFFCLYVGRLMRTHTKKILSAKRHNELRRQKKC